MSHEVTELPVTRNPVSIDSPRRRSRSWKQASAKWVRWLHLYASMISCAVVLFFSVTGITLNHPTWLGGNRENVREMSGELNREWVQVTAAETITNPAQGVQAKAEESSNDVAKLEIVELLRQEARVRGAVKEFTIDDSQCIVAFRAPGYTADVFIDRSTGKYELVESSFGWIAIFNDLHKGRDSGPVWSWIIDVSAGLLVFVSASGLVLLFYINRHRRTGLVTGLCGFAFCVLLYFAFVPH